MVNDSWSEAGNNCTIKWNAKRRRVEVWTVVDVPLYKELGAAYNDTCWYRSDNGIRTYEQAVQIRNYYNKTELPSYGEYTAEATTKAVTPTPESPQSVGQPALNLSINTIDVNMKSDTDGVSTPKKVGTTPGYLNGAHQQDLPMVITLQMEGTKEQEIEEGWKRDALTMTEADYIRKYYHDKAETSTRGSP